MRLLFPLVVVAVIPSCGITPNTSAGICDGLHDAIDDHAESIVENQKETPAQVIITGTRVIRGYDEGCKD